jgi:peptide/nickel transport system ATP-binding protein
MAEPAGAGAEAGAPGPALAPDEPILDVRGLTVEYLTSDGAPRAVDAVDLTLAAGEFVAVVGESGCGKSTLLFGIARLLNPPARTVAGEVDFRGANLVQMTDKELRVVRWRDFSVVMQSAMNALNPVKSVGSQFADAMRAHGRADKAAIAARGREVLALVGIDPVHLKSYPHQLSGGMRQRVMIAMALLFSPELILMDEPTSALDVVAQRSLMVQIKQLQQRLGFAVLFVTHDMSLVSHFSDRLAVMYAGEVIELGATRQVFDSPRHPYTRGLLEAFPSVFGPKSDLAGIPGYPPSLTALPPGCRFAPRCPSASAACSSAVPAAVEVGGVTVRCILYDGSRGARDGATGAGGGVQVAAADAFPAGADGAVPAAPAATVGLPTASAPAATPAAPRTAWPSPIAAPGAEAVPPPLLVTQDLTRHFRIGGLAGKKLHAVDDVDLSIGEGEIVALVGESGSGKSTVARLLTMVYRPTSGSISFDGRDPARLRRRRDLLAYRGEVPMVFQDPFASLNPVHTVGYTMLRGLRLHRPELRTAEVERAAVAALESVGLAPGREVMRRLPHELSGGQRQRVGFAQALSYRPRLVVADEPVSMLDVSIRIGLLNLMNRMRDEQRISFLYITHDIASARYVSDRMLVMYAGHVVEQGTTEAVLHRPVHPYTRLLLSAVPDPRQPIRLELTEVGEPPRVVEPGEGCRFRWRCPLAQPLCHEVTPALRADSPGHLAACHVTVGSGTTGEPAGAAAASAAPAR